MKKYNVAILGATGAVGREMMKILEERNFPIDELRLLASARSVGTVLIYNGEEIIVQEAKATSFESMDFVLGAVGNETAKHFAPYITESKAVSSITLPRSECMTKCRWSYLKSIRPMPSPITASLPTQIAQPSSHSSQ